MRVWIAGLTVMIVAVGWIGTAAAQSAPVDGLVVKESPHSVADTEARLVEALRAAGLQVAFRLDHAANAERAGLGLPPTVLLLFGDPAAGTPLMTAARTTGIDLPMKMLIWEEEGTSRLAYNDPVWIADRHGLRPPPEAVAKMAGALERFASAASAP